MSNPVCVIVGAGPGNGAAFAARYSKEGYTVALLARSKEFSQQLAAELKNCYPYECDVSNTQSIKNTFQQIETELGSVEVVVYNAGSGSWGNIEEITPELLEASWRVNTLGLLAVSQAVIPAMKKNARGSIIVIGATASRRGGINTAAFAPAKAAQRSLAESMAKHLWPQGIHVAMVIIDGVVGLAKTREQMPDKPDSFFVKSEDIANTAFWLSQQPTSTWSFEVEARPFAEQW